MTSEGEGSKGEMERRQGSQASKLASNMAAATRRRLALRTAKRRAAFNKDLFKNHVFYLDVPGYKDADKLESDVIRLGAKVEKFLSKDVTRVITNRRTAGAGGGAAGSSSSSSTAPGKPATPPPVLSRGKALLSKATASAASQQEGSTDPLAIAKQWGIQTWPLAKILRAIKEEGTPPNQRTSPAKRPKILQVRHLNGSFLKIEDASGVYRPLHNTFKTFPRVTVGASKQSGSPFLSTRAALLSKGASKASPTASAGKLGMGTIPNASSPQPEGSKLTISVPPKDQCTESKDSKLTCIPTNSGREGQSVSTKDSNKKTAPKLAGYCECCEVWYQDLRAHIITPGHKDFAEKASNFAVVDETIRQLPGLVGLVTSAAGGQAGCRDGQAIDLATKSLSQDGPTTPMQDSPDDNVGTDTEVRMEINTPHVSDIESVESSIETVAAKRPPVTDGVSPSTAKPTAISLVCDDSIKTDAHGILKPNNEPNVNKDGECTIGVKVEACASLSDKLPDKSKAASPGHDATSSELRISKPDARKSTVAAGEYQAVDPAKCTTSIGQLATIAATASPNPQLGQATTHSEQEDQSRVDNNEVSGSAAMPPSDLQGGQCEFNRSAVVVRTTPQADIATEAADSTSGLNNDNTAETGSHVLTPDTGSYGEPMDTCESITVAAETSTYNIACVAQAAVTAVSCEEAEQNKTESSPASSATCPPANILNVTLKSDVTAVSEQDKILNKKCKLDSIINAVKMNAEKSSAKLSQAIVVQSILDSKTVLGGKAISEAALKPGVSVHNEHGPMEIDNEADKSDVETIIIVAKPYRPDKNNMNAPTKSKKSIENIVNNLIISGPKCVQPSQPVTEVIEKTRPSCESGQPLVLCGTDLNMAPLTAVVGSAGTDKPSVDISIDNTEDTVMGDTHSLNTNTTVKSVPGDISSHESDKSVIVMSAVINIKTNKPETELKADMDKSGTDLKAKESVNNSAAQIAAPVNEPGDANRATCESAVKEFPETSGSTDGTAEQETPMEVETGPPALTSVTNENIMASNNEDGIQVSNRTKTDRRDECNSVVNSDTCKKSVVSGDTCKKSVVSSDTYKKSVASSDTCKKSVVSSDTCKESVVRGDTCKSSVVSGDTCKKSVVSGDTCKKSVVSGDTCKKSVVSGDTYRNSAVSGDTCKNSVVSGDTCKKLAVSGDTCKKLAVSGDTCKKSVVSSDTHKKSVVSSDTGNKPVANSDTCSEQNTKSVDTNCHATRSKSPKPNAKITEQHSHSTRSKSPKSACKSSERSPKAKISSIKGDESSGKCDNSTGKSSDSNRQKESRTKSPVSSTKHDSRSKSPISSNKCETRTKSPVSTMKPDTRAKSPVVSLRPESRAKSPISSAKSESRGKSPVSSSKSEHGTKSPSTSTLSTKPDSRAKSPISSSKHKDANAKSKDSRPKSPISSSKSKDVHVKNSDSNHKVKDSAKDSSGKQRNTNIKLKETSKSKESRSKSPMNNAKLKDSRSKSSGESSRHKETSTRHGDNETKHKDKTKAMCVKHKDTSAKPKDYSSKSKGSYSKHKDASAKHKESSSKSKDTSIKHKETKSKGSKSKDSRKTSKDSSCKSNDSDNKTKDSSSKSKDIVVKSKVCSSKQKDSGMSDKDSVDKTKESPNKQDGVNGKAKQATDKPRGADKTQNNNGKPNEQDKKTQIKNKNHEESVVTSMDIIQNKNPPPETENKSSSENQTPHTPRDTTLSVPTEPTKDDKPVATESAVPTSQPPDAEQSSGDTCPVISTNEDLSAADLLVVSSIVNTVSSDTITSVVNALTKSTNISLPVTDCDNKNMTTISTMQDQLTTTAVSNVTSKPSQDSNAAITTAASMGNQPTTVSSVAAVPTPSTPVAAEHLSKLLPAVSSSLVTPVVSDADLASLAATVAPSVDTSCSKTQQDVLADIAELCQGQNIGAPVGGHSPNHEILPLNEDNTDLLNGLKLDDMELPDIGLIENMDCEDFENEEPGAQPAGGLLFDMLEYTPAKHKTDLLELNTIGDPIDIANVLSQEKSTNSFSADFSDMSDEEDDDKVKLPWQQIMNSLADDSESSSNIEAPAKAVENKPSLQFDPKLGSVPQPIMALTKEFEAIQSAVAKDAKAADTKLECKEDNASPKTPSGPPRPTAVAQPSKEQTLCGQAAKDAEVKKDPNLSSKEKFEKYKRDLQKALAGHAQPEIKSAVNNNSDGNKSVSGTTTGGKKDTVSRKQSDTKLSTDKKSTSSDIDQTLSQSLMKGTSNEIEIRDDKVQPLDPLRGNNKTGQTDKQSDVKSDLRTASAVGESVSVKRKHCSGGVPRESKILKSEPGCITSSLQKSTTAIGTSKSAVSRKSSETAAPSAQVCCQPHSGPSRPGKAGQPVSKQPPTTSTGATTKKLLTGAGKTKQVNSSPMAKHKEPLKPARFTALGAPMTLGASKAKRPKLAADPLKPAKSSGLASVGTRPPQNPPIPGCTAITSTTKAVSSVKARAQTGLCTRTTTNTPIRQNRPSKISVSPVTISPVPASASPLSAGLHVAVSMAAPTTQPMTSASRRQQHDTPIAVNKPPIPPSSVSTVSQSTVTQPATSQTSRLSSMSCTVTTASHTVVMTSRAVTAVPRKPGINAVMSTPALSPSRTQCQKSVAAIPPTKPTQTMAGTLAQCTRGAIVAADGLAPGLSVDVKPPHLTGKPATSQPEAGTRGCQSIATQALPTGPTMTSALVVPHTAHMMTSPQPPHSAAHGRDAQHAYMQSTRPASQSALPHGRPGMVPAPASVPGVHPQVTRPLSAASHPPPPYSTSPSAGPVSVPSPVLTQANQQPIGMPSQPLQTIQQGPPPPYIPPSGLSSIPCSQPGDHMARVKLGLAPGNRPMSSHSSLMTNPALSLMTPSPQSSATATRPPFVMAPTKPASMASITGANTLATPITVPSAISTFNPVRPYDGVRVKQEFPISEATGKPLPSGCHGMYEGPNRDYFSPGALGLPSFNIQANQSSIVTRFAGGPSPPVEFPGSIHTPAGNPLRYVDNYLECASPNVSPVVIAPRSSPSPSSVNARSTQGAADAGADTQVVSKAPTDKGKLPGDAPVDDLDHTLVAERSGSKAEYSPRDKADASRTPVSDPSSEPASMDFTPTSERTFSPRDRGDLLKHDDNANSDAWSTGVKSVDSGCPSSVESSVREPCTEVEARDLKGPLPDTADMAFTPFSLRPEANVEAGTAADPKGLPPHVGGPSPQHHHLGFPSNQLFPDPALALTQTTTGRPLADSETSGHETNDSGTWEQHRVQGLDPPDLHDSSSNFSQYSNASTASRSSRKMRHKKTRHRKTTKEAADPNASVATEQTKWKAAPTNGLKTKIVLVNNSPDEPKLPSRHVTFSPACSSESSPEESPASKWAPAAPMQGLKLKLSRVARTPPEGADDDGEGVKWSIQRSGDCKLVLSTARLLAASSGTHCSKKKKGRRKLAL